MMVSHMTQRHTTGPAAFASSSSSWPVSGQMSGSFPVQQDHLHSYLVVLVLAPVMPNSERQREFFVDLLFSHIQGECHSRLVEDIDYQHFKHGFHLLRNQPIPAQRHTVLREVRFPGSREDLHDTLLEAVGVMSASILRVHDITVACLD